MNSNPSVNLLGLDSGSKRVGVAMARADILIPVALTTLNRSAETFWEQLDAIVDEYKIGEIVLGLPRGLDGQETAQTTVSRQFGDTVKKRYPKTSIVWQDEALTSVKAEAILKQSKQSYTKSDIDALAACYILTDYLESKRVTAA